MPINDEASGASVDQDPGSAAELTASAAAEVVARNAAIAAQHVSDNATYVPNGYPTDVASRTGAYHAIRCLYNAKASQFYKVRAALGKAMQAGSGNILCIGDSTTECAGNGSQTSTQSWPAQMMNLLTQAGIPDGGTGWCFANHQTFDSARWTTTSWTSPGVGGHYLTTSTNGLTATFTSDRIGTALDIAYINQGGAWTYNVDGAGPVTVTPSGTNTVATVSVTGLSNTTHTVVITTTTATNTYLLGARVRAASGLSITNAGVSGSLTGGWLPTATFPGLYTTAAVPGTTYDAVFLSLGINDSFTLTAAVVKANLQAIITALAGASIILWVPPHLQSEPAEFAGIRQAYYDLADTNNLPLLDLGDLQGSWAVANTNGLRFDGVHPNTAGCADTARAFGQLLIAEGPSPAERTWTAPTLVNSWVNFGGTYSTAGFRKDASGYVVLRGLIKSGTATSGTILFTLPAGYRPATGMIAATTANAAHGEVFIGTDGTVRIQAGSNAYFSLENIRFLPSQ